MKCQVIKIVRRQIGPREVDVIRVVINDLHLSADLVHASQIRAAKRLADDHQCAFLYDESTAPQVREVLGIKE